jgi:hypothetical protein
MQNPALAPTLIIVGAVLVVLSVFADTVGLGRQPGYGWKQVLGAVIGALAILAGEYLRRRLARR